MKKKTAMQDILHGLADQATPAKFDLWDRINRQVTRRPITHRQNVLVGLATLSIGLFIMLALILTIKSQPIVAVLASPTAIEVATQAPTISTPIKSYRGIIFGQSRSESYPDNPNPPAYQLWEAYIWYQAPYFLRIEEYPTCFKTPVTAPGQTPALLPLARGLRADFTGPTFARCSEPAQITIHTDQWIIHVVNEGYSMTATYGDLTNVGVLGASLPVGVSTFWPNSQSSMFSMGRDADYPSATYGSPTDDTIIGRAAKKFDEALDFYLTGQPPVKQQIHRSLWVDEEIGIPIAAEAMDDQGFIWDSWTFSLLEVNSPTDPSLFAYLPRPTTSVTIDGLTTIWGQMAHNATFTVFAPGGTAANLYIASTLMPEYPAYDTANHILKQTYLSRADPEKYTVALTITEQPASGTPAAGYQYQEANDKRTLAFDRSGTHIVIESSDELTKQDLYDISDNMRPQS